MIGLFSVPTAATTYFTRVKDERESFKLKCSLLPKKEADKLRAERKQEREERKEHREKLEIANAGRTRNFWGN